jgi:hypothetical protein
VWQADSLLGEFLERLLLAGLEPAGIAFNE